MIVKEKNGYSVKSEDGSKHLGGPYPSRDKAERRLKQVEYFRNRDTHNMEQITFNITPDPKGIRYEMLEGVRYMVIPTVMLTEGVHQGSQGPLLYPKKELSKTPQVWNTKPVVVYHPTINGKGVSACTPEVLATRRCGMMMQTNWNGKLRTETWLDPIKTNAVDARIVPMIKKGKPIEVSTGLFTDNVPKPGVFNGEEYDAIATNYRPDHLAILPDKVGACSVADGAGLLQFNERWPDERRKDWPDEDFAEPGFRAFPIENQEDVDVVDAILTNSTDGGEAIRHRVIDIAKRKDLKVPDAWLSNDSDKADPVVPVANDAMSHSDTRQAIYKKLNPSKSSSTSGYKGVGGSSTYHALEEVYDEFYVYTDGNDGKMYKQGYSKDKKGGISHSGKKEEVRKHSEYRKVGDGAYVGHANNVSTSSRKEQVMDREQVIDNLIANHGWEEGDREFLESLEDHHLQKLETSIKGAAKKGTKEGRPGQEGEGETDQDIEEKKGKKGVKNAKTKPKGKDDDESEDEGTKNEEEPLTDEEWLERAPAGIRETVENSREVVQQEKDVLIANILKVKGNRFTKVALNDMRLKDLQNIASLIPQAPAPARRIPQYVGANAGDLPAENEEVEKPLGLPTLNGKFGADWLDKKPKK